MSIKDIIIDKVNAIDNPELLQTILHTISIEMDTEEIYKFSEEEEIQLQEGLQDIKNRNVFTELESKKKISKWLEEKSNGLLAP